MSFLQNHFQLPRRCTQHSLSLMHRRIHGVQLCQIVPWKGRIFAVECPSRLRVPFSNQDRLLSIRSEVFYPSQLGITTPVASSVSALVKLVTSNREDRRFWRCHLTSFF